ncbi:MAG: nitroreductase family protein, partial [bacterium]|nr:nitroreductase family protein [bacterium]
MTDSVFNLIKKRRSIRKYQPRPVEREKLRKCLEAARLAPSAENVQPWRFIVIDDPDLKNRFAKEVFSGIYFPMKFAQQAPVIVIILAKRDLIANRIGKQIQGIHYYFIDVGIAGQHLVLQAQELGLGSCWIGWFNPRKVRKFFNIPKSYQVASLISLGYPAQEKSEVKNRSPLDKIAWFNGFKNEDQN